MLKQSLFVLLGSLLVILLATEIAFLLNYMDKMHLFLGRALGKIFAGGEIGRIIQSTVALFLIPFIIALIPTALYYAATRKSLPYFPHILWVSWIILATVLIVR